MLVAAISYFLFSPVAENLIGGIFANASAMYSILAIGIFATLALWFIPGAKKYSIGAFLLCVIAYAGIEILAPYAGVLTTVIAVIATIAVLIMVKRPILRYLHNANGRALPTWGRIALYLL